MTQERKDLLLKDLSARLPYGVKFSYVSDKDKTQFVLSEIGMLMRYSIEEGHVMPYLRPMSSMTEEEEREFKSTCNIIGFYKDGEFACTPEGYDWLNAHHFDYRGLIPMGLALEAKEGMYE